MANSNNPQELCSTVTAAGKIVLSLEPIEQLKPQEDEVVVAVEAAPINPSDLGLMFGPADMSTLRAETIGGCPALVADIPQEMQSAVSMRVGQKVPVGNEGAGTVVAAGSSAAAQGLLGRAVSLVTGNMYRTHVLVKANQVVVLPEGARPVEGAALFVNPMTALGFVATMRDEGHTALVHTAAASNLGQMLARLCLKEQIPLVAIVRSAAQEEILRHIGLSHVINSSTDNFLSQLTEAVAKTQATMAFDAIGGGTMANSILQCMEQAQRRQGPFHPVYGSPIHKKIYTYGRLDRSLTTISAGHGFRWSVSGWLLTDILERLGPQKTMDMRRYALEERNGIFASQYIQSISLNELLEPAIAAKYAEAKTGQKVLVDPSMTA